MNQNIEELRNLTLEEEGLKARKEAIKKLAHEHRDSLGNDDIVKANAELDEIEQKLSTIEERRASITANHNEERSTIMENINLEQNTPEVEKRDALLNNFMKLERKHFKIHQEINEGKIASKRSVLIASDGIAKPTKVSEINGLLGAPVSLLDDCYVVDMEGAGADKVPYTKAGITAHTKNDGSAVTASDPTFRTVTITPTIIEALTYVSKFVRRVSPLKYLERVTELSVSALKDRLVDFTIDKIKTGLNDNSEVISATLTASATNGMLSSSKGNINEKTLRNIVFAYGGNSSVYGNAVLYLNKADLIAFGDVRGTNEKKAVYEIIPDQANPNRGIIKDGGLSVPYCIVPSLNTLAGTSQTTSAVQTMIYGAPLNFQLDLFGDYEVEVFAETKAEQGLDTVIANVMAGGCVRFHEGFVVVTIPATT